MAVVEMKTIYISALKKDRQKLVEYLQRQGVVEVSEFKCGDSQVFSLPDTSSQVAGLQTDYKLASDAEAIIDRYSPMKPSLFDSFEGKAAKSVAEYEDFHQGYKEAMGLAGALCAAEGKIDLTNSQISELSDEKQALTPWESFPFSLNYSGTKNSSAFIGVLPKSYTQDELEAEVAALDEAPEDFVFQIISVQREQSCITALCLRKNKDRLLALLDKLQFCGPGVSADEPPRKLMDNLEKRILDKEASLEKYKEQLLLLCARRDEISFLTDYLSILIEEHRAFGSLGESKYVFVLKGCIPAAEQPRITKELESRFGCAVAVEDITEDEEDVPVLMRNSWFSEPVEGVVTSYNYPKYGELDPTAVTSFFYYIMFGLMFSDAGYGAILAIACGALLLKYKDMSPSLNRFLRLFFWCGISTIFWGIVFSSYFGDAVDVISTTFLGRHLTIPPLWFSPLDNPMKLLLFCLAIGVIHLLTGYFMNAYSALKGKDPAAAIFDSLFPVIFLLSLLVVFVGSSMFEGLAGFTIEAGPAVYKICYAIAALAALGILLMGGRESKNWVKRLLKGIFALYNVIAGWLSDILSYSRLLALGLATGIIGSVVNTLGVMVGKNIFGIIVLVAVFLFGHLLNFGINILGSYVHSNRLEYVEFFGKFYEGGGREFKPLSLNTKYYTIREEK